MSDDHHDDRGYAGQLAGGQLRPRLGGRGAVRGRTTAVEAIDTFSCEVQAAFPRTSVALRLADEIDISRGT